MNEMDHLQQEIDQRKLQLIEIYKELPFLDQGKILSLSQELDQLILKYQIHVAQLRRSELK